VSVTVLSACRLCRPSGSGDVYYVDSGTEEVSAAVSETTVESTHAGIIIIVIMSTYTTRP